MTKVELENHVVELNNKIVELEKALLDSNTDNDAKKIRIAELIEKIDAVGLNDQSGNLPPVTGIFRDMDEVLVFLEYLKRLNNVFNIVTPEWLTDAVLDFPEAQMKYEAETAQAEETRAKAYEEAREENRKSAQERKERFEAKEAERRAKFHNNEL